MATATTLSLKKRPHSLYIFNNWAKMNRLSKFLVYRIQGKFHVKS